ncbi:phytanoyl-CoA dioxygenase family protein [Dactylosporangium salmoneum]|uniref:phytanoyl-CoA dioxygenase family protein n=1 Tax=Dactylosporangium salmoneum TaxID=53361 RepID=UPI0031D7D398
MSVTRDFALSEDELALLPTDEEVEAYARNGWYLTRKLFTDDEVDALVAASERFYAGERSRTLPARPPRLAYWQPEHGPVQRHNDYVHYEHDDIARILRKPIVGAVAARLAQADEIRVFQSTLIYKPPIAGEPSNVVPWHFDRHYWQTCTSDDMLTAFIPFHDCGVDMGTITMVEGSHRWREIGADDTTTRHFADRDRSDLERMLEDNAAHNQAEVRKVPMLIPKGHMSFHHCRTYHGSGANVSAHPRRAISFHLQPGGNEYRQFHLSTGDAVTYNHDVLVRRTEDGRPDYADPEFCPVLWRNA